MPRAKKHLGQHFLTSNKIVGQIITVADLSSNDIVLEVGPGKGVLTKALLTSGARVVAIEKDGDLIGHLQNIFSKEISQRQLMLLHADILTFNSTAQGLSEHRYKIVANIPYYITGEILRRFLAETLQPSHMVLLLQKEVAERIVAKNGKESILSLSVKLYGSPRIALRVPKKFFAPVPQVDSAVLVIRDIGSSGLSKAQEHRFFQIVKQGFSQKRKQVLPLLSKILEQKKVREVFHTFNISETIRAEDLPLPVWIALSKY